MEEIMFIEQCHFIFFFDKDYMNGIIGTKEEYEKNLENRARQLGCQLITGELTPPSSEGLLVSLSLFERNRVIPHSDNALHKR